MEQRSKKIIKQKKQQPNRNKQKSKIQQLMESNGYYYDKEKDAYFLLKDQRTKDLTLDEIKMKYTDKKQTIDLSKTFSIRELTLGNYNKYLFQKIKSFKKKTTKMYLEEFKLINLIKGVVGVESQRFKDRKEFQKQFKEDFNPLNSIKYKIICKSGNQIKIFFKQVQKNEKNQLLFMVYFESQTLVIENIKNNQIKPFMHINNTDKLFKIYSQNFHHLLNFSDYKEVHIKRIKKRQYEIILEKDSQFLSILYERQKGEQTGNIKSFFVFQINPYFQSSQKLIDKSIDNLQIYFIKFLENKVLFYFKILDDPQDKFQSEISFLPGFEARQIYISCKNRVLIVHSTSSKIILLKIKIKEQKFNIFHKKIKLQKIISEQFFGLKQIFLLEDNKESELINLLVIKEDENWIPEIKLIAIYQADHQWKIEQRRIINQHMILRNYFSSSNNKETYKFFLEKIQFLKRSYHILKISAQQSKVNVLFLISNINPFQKQILAIKDNSQHWNYNLAFEDKYLLPISLQTQQNQKQLIFPFKWMTQTQENNQISLKLNFNFYFFDICY